MAHFYVYETVEFPIKFSDKEALVGAKEIMISIKQNKTQLDISDVDIDFDEGVVTFRLSQEQTAQFTKGKATVQVNIYYDDNERDTTTQTTLDVYDNLYKEYMS